MFNDNLNGWIPSREEKDERGMRLAIGDAFHLPLKGWRYSSADDNYRYMVLCHYSDEWSDNRQTEMHIENGVAVRCAYAAWYKQNIRGKIFVVVSLGTGAYGIGSTTYRFPTYRAKCLGESGMISLCFNHNYNFGIPSVDVIGVHKPTKEKHETAMRLLAEMDSLSEVIVGDISPIAP